MSDREKKKNDKKKDKDALNSLFAFTFFYSFAIYGLMLCFIYKKWNNNEKG